VAAGASREEAEQNMYQAIEMHIKGLREDGLPVPDSTSFAEYVAMQSGIRSQNFFHSFKRRLG
jgi:predicted RNase H-like HicB family nuclease